MLDNILICNDGIGALKKMTGSQGKTLSEVELNLLVQRISTALKLLFIDDPYTKRKLLTSIKQIVLFENDVKNGFANSAMPGTIFINVKWGSSVPFFIEEIAHQGGHVLVSAMTIDPSAYFSEKGSLYMIDERTAYTVLHGTITEMFMLDCLHQCLIEFKGANHDIELELNGRITYTLVRFIYDLNALLEKDVLSTSSKAISVFLENALIDMLILYRNHIDQYSLQNQRYNFSFDKFKEANHKTMSLAN